MSAKSLLEAIGHDFKKGLDIILPWASGAVNVASIFVPALGPAWKVTVLAVGLAEQKFSALGQQKGSGPAKLADVLQIAEPVISIALSDTGQDGTRAGVIAYINSVVKALNTAPPDLLTN